MWRIYKEGQGKWGRGLLAFVIAIGSIYAVASVHESLPIPKERWTRTTDLLIFHGRKICIARRPLCGQCPVFALCRWPQRQAFAMGKPPRAKAGPGSASRRRRRAPRAKV